MVPPTTLLQMFERPVLMAPSPMDQCTRGMDIMMFDIGILFNHVVQYEKQMEAIRRYYGLEPQSVLPKDQSLFNNR